MQSPNSESRRARRESLILLAALLFGLGFGTLGHFLAETHAWIPALVTQVFLPFGQVFLRMLFMIIVPMVFCALSLGVLELSRTHGLGKTLGRTLLFTLITSLISVAVGLSLVELVGPGRGLPESVRLSVSETATAEVAKLSSQAAVAKPALQVIAELLPRNPIQAASLALDGEMLPFMIFTVLFALAMGLSRRALGPDAPGGSFETLAQEVFDASMVIVRWAMKLAPFAIFSLVFASASRFGPGVFKNLFLYVAVVVGGILFQQYVVYAAMLRVLGGISPLPWFRKTREVLLYAFATASSNATLPRSLALAEGPLGIPRNVSRFVLTVGSTANQNGTALFEGVTVLFLAQVYGIDLALGDQLVVVFMSVLAGIGTAGVPGGSLPLIMVLLKQVGIPLEGIGLVLGVDRFLDMCRTALNVSGDLVIAQLVAKPGLESSSETA